MSNVVYLKRSTGIVEPPDLEGFAPLPACTSELRKRLDGVREDVRLTLFMLDLAVAHARRFAQATDDFQLKKKVEDHLVVMQELLEVARQKASAL